MSKKTGAREPIKAEKIDRNAPCPCGSGKKYKKCCDGELSFWARLRSWLPFGKTTKKE